MGKIGSTEIIMSNGENTQLYKSMGENWIWPKYNLLEDLPDKGDESAELLGQFQ